MIASPERRVTDTADEVRARAVVLRHALDPADAIELLDMLGLGDVQPEPVPRVCEAAPARRRGTVLAVSAATEARLAQPPAPEPASEPEPEPDPPAPAPKPTPKPKTAPAPAERPCESCGTTTVPQTRYKLDPDGYRARGVRLRAAKGLCWRCYSPPGGPVAKPKRPRQEPKPKPPAKRARQAASATDRWATPIVVDRWAAALVDANTRLAAANDELEELRAQLAEARRDVGTWEGEYERVVDDQLVDVADHAELKAERDVLAERLAVVERERMETCEHLAEASLRIAEMQVAVGRVVELADQLAAAAEPPPHRHAWEWQPELAALPLPCSCGERPPGGA